MKILIGSVLYGYCGGVFGRDSYENKRVEAFGADWIICRDKKGCIHYAVFDNPYEIYGLEKYLEDKEG